MTAPELDLQIAVATASQALYEAHLAALIRRGADAANAPTWESLRPIEQYHFRNLALPVVLSAIPEIARQAWDIGAEAGDDSIDGVELNPWENLNDWDEALRGL